MRAPREHPNLVPLSALSLPKPAAGLMLLVALSAGLSACAPERFRGDALRYAEQQCRERRNPDDVQRCLDEVRKQYAR